MSDNDKLRGRVRQQRQHAESQGSEIAPRDQPGTVYEFIEQLKPQIARALPRHLNADRLARIMLTEVRRTPLLARCTPESFGGAIMTCAQLGLEPGVTGEAYLLPFRNTKKNCYEVQLIIGYQGMLALYWRSPLAKSFDAQAVYQNDEFDYAYGLEPKLHHKPALGDRGEAVAYYAVATMTQGGSAFVVMSRHDVEKIRARSRARNEGPWVTDYDAMAKKTCIRQLFKLLPKSAEMAQALAADESVRTDLSADALDTPQDYPDAVTGAVVDDPPQPPEPDPPAAARQHDEPPVVVEDLPEGLFEGDEAA